MAIFHQKLWGWGPISEILAYILPQFAAKQPAGRNSQKTTEKLGAIPNQRIKKRENALVVVKTPLILSLTPNTPTLTPPIPLILLKKSILTIFSL